MITLVLGGARSGKSRFAEMQADHWLRKNPSGERVYIATAQAFDDEMRDKVAHHKVQRGTNWRTIEEPFELVRCLTEENAENRFLLVDCLTLWLSNLVLNGIDANGATDRLCTCLEKTQGEIVIVSNEVGLGIVPVNKLSRQFRDIQGSANQRLAAAAHKVVLVTAGLPLVLKGEN